MTPFGAKLRSLRARAGLKQAELAEQLGVSAAYLSALERGQRGRPSWAIVQKCIELFGLIWEDADELERLSRLSHPRVVIDTANLSPKATELANLLARNVQRLDDETFDQLLAIMKRPTKGKS